jgi:Glycosyltransferase
MGGDTRHFATLAEDLDNHKHFGVKLINTSRGQEHSRLVRNLAVALRTLLAVIANLRSVDVVSYHASDRGMVLFGPFIVGLSRLLGTPIVLRIFGGSFGDFYQRQGAVAKTIIRKSILSSDVVLLQTRRAVQQLQDQATGRLVWFSTYIKTVVRAAGHAQDNSRDDNCMCSRFVFLGHLWRTKGLETILEAAPQLPDGSRIDIYGPLDEYSAEEIRERGMGRVHYRGFLTHSQVDAKLWEYDCLVLPTCHPGEGYPGAIAEAFAHALPVITTRWLAIPEIVDEGCGILIEPNDTQAFVAAMTALHQDKSLWHRLKAGARSKAAQFDHAVWSRKFEEICEELVRT